MKILNIFTISSTPKAFFDGQFNYLSNAGNEIWVAASSEEPVEFVQSNSVTYRKFDIRRSISPFADLRTIAVLRAFIHREQFDVVIGHTPKGAMVAMIAAKLAGVKTRIYYRHGLIYTTAAGLKRKIFKIVEQFTAACSTHIVNVSPSLSKLAVKDHLNSDKKQTVIGAGTCGGIDTINTFNPDIISQSEITSLKTSLGIDEHDFVVGFCGRLCKEKGIRELIDGFILFNKENPSSKLLLVGPLDSRDILPENYKNEIENNPNIISPGQIEKSNLPLYYSLMDVFVFPSYREGFGMCVIEASAMKVPVLVSKSHGCIDSIVEGLTGEYINLSAESINNGIKNMMNEDKRPEYGENGRKWVTSNYDWTVMWPKIAAFYSSLKQ